MDEVTITAAQTGVSKDMDRQIYSLAKDIGAGSGSVLQALQHLPNITLSEGKLELRGSDKIAILADGKHTAVAGFGAPQGLDNIPASNIDRIEIITNPSAKYDANASAGIINIIYKKNSADGISGSAGLAAGALWKRQDNLPGIAPQYVRTPKFNPTLAANYRRNSVNLFFTGDYLYTQTLNKNEYVLRTYNDGHQVRSQLRRNRDTHFAIIKGGADCYLNADNTLPCRRYTAVKTS